jgi:hypothetical protein
MQNNKVQSGYSSYYTVLRTIVSTMMRLTFVNVWKANDVLRSHRQLFSGRGGIWDEQVCVSSFKS